MLIWITVAVTILGFAAYWLMEAVDLSGYSTTNTAAKRDHKPARKRQRLSVAERMMVFVSIAVLCSSLFVILSGRYDDASQRWAIASSASIFGFWCRRK